METVKILNNIIDMVEEEVDNLTIYEVDFESLIREGKATIGVYFNGDYNMNQLEAKIKEIVHEEEYIVNHISIKNIVYTDEIDEDEINIAAYKV